MHVFFPDGMTLNDVHIETLIRSLPTWVATGGLQPLELNLEGVIALSSCALGKLLRLDRAVRAAGGRLILLNLSPSVRRLFRVTRLDTVLRIGATSGSQVV